MDIINHFLLKIIQFVGYLLNIYVWVIIARAAISWVNADPHNPIVRFIYEVTEPVLGRIRRWMPFNMGGIDFSPMILILIIMFVESVLFSTFERIFAG